MPEERGSIYKSTANEIGEALKAKLGGEGFAPKDWSDNLNLLGIASEDTEAAINSLKESEGSGERGSILLSTANAIGSMLNKKYNSQRGFSPAEWASATRKMKALETDTKSGGIVNLKGAKEVPLTSLVATINPNLEGVSSVDVVATGKNLFDKSAISPNTWIIVNSTETEPTPSYLTSDYIPVKANTKYYISTKSSNRSAYYDRNKNGIAYFSFSGGASFTCLYDGYIRITINNTIDLDTFVVNEGDEAIDYEPFGTTYTANLGRTIYGGSADIVKGEGVEGYGIVDLGTLTWTKRNTSSGHWRFTTQDVPVVINDDASHVPSMVCTEYTAISPTQSWNGVEGVSCNTGISQLMVCDESYETASDFTSAVSGVYLVYPLATPTDFAFDPIQINTSGDTENFYTSNGDTSITYYEEPTPYTRGSASGMIASIPEANTEFPFTKLKATIAPSVEGVSSVEVKNEGKNLFDGSLFPQTITATSYYSNFTYNSGNMPLIRIKPNTQYTISLDVSSDAEPFNVSVGLGNGTYLTDLNTAFNNTSGTISVTFSVTSAQIEQYGNILALRAPRYSSSTTFTVTVSNPMLEVGSSATQFEPYKQPTTYTAELGETVYGGSVDLVSGEVKSEYASDVMTSSYLSGLNTDYIGYEASNAYFGNHPSVWVQNWNYQRAAARKAGGIGCTCNYFPASMNNTTIFSSQYRIYFDVDGKNITSVQDFINYVANIEQGGNSLKIAFELATPTESSIEPQEIYPNEGVNNIWNDANGITEVGYFGE